MRRLRPAIPPGSSAWSFAYLLSVQVFTLKLYLWIQTKLYPLFWETCSSQETVYYTLRITKVVHIIDDMNTMSYGCDV
jgi:hypothetical protein